MVGARSNWEDELGGWLKPFLDRLGHKARRRMCPLYVAGLIGPGDRKSVQPMAERLAPGDYDQLHHFVAAGVWDRRGLGDVEAASDYGDWRAAQLDGVVADFYAGDSLLPVPRARAAGSATSSRVAKAISRKGERRFVPCLRSP